MKTKQRFTLIEMLVVIAIIGILASLLMPSLKNAMDTAKALQCLNNQKQIGTAEFLYAEDYNGIINSFSQFISPSSEMVWWMWLNGGYRNNSIYLNGGLYDLPTQYIADQNTFLCPGHEPETFSISKVYNVYGQMNYGTNSGSWVFERGTTYGKMLKFLKPYQAPKPSLRPLFSDSLRYNNTYQFYYFGGFYDIHLRHQQGANMVFIDGHASNNKISDLENLGFDKAVDEYYNQLTF